LVVIIDETNEDINKKVRELLGLTRRQIIRQKVDTAIHCPVFDSKDKNSAHKKAKLENEV